MQGYPYLSFGARPERAAPARPRSPVGHWVKLPTSWRHDATTIALALGTLAAFALTRHRFFGKHAVGLAIVLPIALPGIVTAVALASALALAG